MHSKLKVKVPENKKKEYKKILENNGMCKRLILGCYPKIKRLQKKDKKYIKTKQISLIKATTLSAISNIIIKISK